MGLNRLDRECHLYFACKNMYFRITLNRAQQLEFALKEKKDQYCNTWPTGG